MASTQLRRYDPGAFGLNEAWVKRSDPAALAAGVEAAVGRMNEWLAERQRAERPGAEPGDRDGGTGETDGK